MQSRRDYLIGLGLAKPGRGKFSNDAKEALRKAESQGVKFSDATGVVAPTRSVGTKDSNRPEIPAAAPDPRNSDYLLPTMFRFPETEYKAVGTVDGKTYGMRECCNKCRVSLTNHGCNEPTILGNIPVHIRSK